MVRCVEAEHLVRQLIRNYRLYFSKDLRLNSEGMKLLNIIARVVMENCKEAISILRKVRKDPTLENVIKLVSYVLEEKPEVLISSYIYGDLGT